MAQHLDDCSSPERAVLLGAEVAPFAVARSSAQLLALPGYAVQQDVRDCGLASASEQFGQQISSDCPCRLPTPRLARMIEMSIAGPKVNQLAVAGSEHKLSFRLCQLSVGEHHDLPSAEPIPANSQGAARNRAGY